MASSNYPEKFLLEGNDQLKAIMEELKLSHADGNPLVLFHVIRFCQSHEIALPNWASEEILVILSSYLTGETSGHVGKSNSPFGRYKERMKKVVRARTYRSIFNWSRDTRHFKAMPRSVIQKWFNNEITAEPKSAEEVMELAVAALAPTFAACQISTLSNDRYYDPYKDLTIEQREALEPSMGIDAYASDEILEHLKIQDYLGPPECEPPPHVKRILDTIPKH